MNELLEGIKLTRSTDEGRGVIGRVDQMTEASQRLNEASAEGQKKDGVAIHAATEKGVVKVQKAVEWVGGKVEGAAKFADRLYRGAESNVKKVVDNGWKLVKGFGEDTHDVIAGTTKAVLTGAKWTAIGAGVTAATVAATPIVIAETAAMGMVELGQHGAKKLSELRAKVNGGVLHGIHCLAAAVDARALTGKEYEAKRVVNVREQHQRRVETIRDNNLGVLAVRAGKSMLQNRR